MGIRCKISRFCLALADGRLLNTLVGLRWMRWWIAGGEMNTLHSNMATHMPAFNILEVQWLSLPNTMRHVLPKKAGRPWSTPWITRRSRRLSVLLHDERGPAVMILCRDGNMSSFWGCACLCICWSWVTRRLRWACGTWNNEDTAKKRSRRKHLSVFDSRYSIWFCVLAPIARGRFSSSKPNGFRLHPYGHPRGWRHELIQPLAEGWRKRTILGRNKMIQEYTTYKYGIDIGIIYCYKITTIYFDFLYLSIYVFIALPSTSVSLRLRHRTGPHSGRCLDPGIEMVWNDLQQYPVIFRKMYPGGFLRSLAWWQVLTQCREPLILRTIEGLLSTIWKGMVEGNEGIIMIVSSCFVHDFVIPRSYSCGWTPLRVFLLTWSQICTGSFPVIEPCPSLKGKCLPSWQVSKEQRMWCQRLKICSLWHLWAVQLPYIASLCVIHLPSLCT